MSLEVRGLTKHYGGRTVVQDVSFDVAAGDLVALLGPSGSGKSTILRIVAGLTPSDAGSVRVEGADMTGLPPQARDLGFVFQNYALFEHLTVADNVEFALRMRGTGRGERRARRDELLELVGLGGSARKYPAQLSGGQRQRTALARALAHRPRLLLLDEPFGALDARIRQELRQGLRELLKRLGTTAIFVTHDQEEAFAVADRIMVLHRGRLLEEGPPQQLYAEPGTEFVAGFVGRANLLPGELTDAGVRVRLEGGPARADVVPRRVKVLLRPEKLRLLRGGTPVPPGLGFFSHDAVVDRIEYLGASERVHVTIQTGQQDTGRRRYQLESLRTIDTARQLPLRAGDGVTLFAEHMHAIRQPDLRLLVLGADDPEGHALVRTALAYGERHHALITVLGDAVRAPGLQACLEQHRQAFAGDLKLIDTHDMGMDLWKAATAHLCGESYDLVMVPASMRDPERILAFLRRVRVQHLCVPADAGNPLDGNASGHWSVLLRAFAASQPDLNLLAEIAAGIGADVEVRDLESAVHAAESTPRWRMALDLRRVAFTVARKPRPADRYGVVSIDAVPIDAAAGLIAVDLGPRAGLGVRQRAWLDALQKHWLLLMVQPDESDLGVLQSRDFLSPRPALLELPRADERSRRIAP